MTPADRIARDDVSTDPYDYLTVEEDVTTMSELDVLTEIIPGQLWQSGSRVADTESDRFDAIVALGESLQGWHRHWMRQGWARLERGKPRLPLLVHAPLIDARGWLDHATAAATAHFTVALLRSGRRVLIHCDAGVFRSVFMASLVLAEMKGLTGLEACHRIESQRQGRENPLGRRLGIGIVDYDEMLRHWPAEPTKESA